MSDNLPVLRKKAEDIDAVVRQVQAEMADNVGGNIVRALAMSGAVKQIEAMLTPDVVSELSDGLQNMSFGFMTDRANNSDGKPTKYEPHVVKQCLLEAALRGLNVMGNEFNILAGRFYVTKNGMANMVLRFPGLSQYAEEYDPPDLPDNFEWKKVGSYNKPIPKQCVVKCRASWKLNGKPDSMDAEIPIVCFPNTTVDAVLGKANRKLKARVHERLMGMALADFDADVEEPQRQETKQQGKVSALASAMADTVAAKTGEPVKDAAFEKEPSPTLAKDGEVIFGVGDEDRDPVDDLSDEDVIAQLEEFCAGAAAIDKCKPGEACAKYLRGEIDGHAYVPGSGPSWFTQGDTEERKQRRMSAARTHLSMILAMGAKEYMESFK